MTPQDLILVKLACASIEGARRHKLSCVRLTLKCVKQWDSSVYAHDIGEELELLFEHDDETGEGGFSVAAEYPDGADFEIITEAELLEYFEISKSVYVYGVVETAE